MWKVYEKSCPSLIYGVFDNCFDAQKCYYAHRTTSANFGAVMERI